MLKFYWSLGEDICEKQKQYKWGANFMKRLSLDLRAEFPQAEGFSWSNLYKIRKWYLFYSSQIDFLYQAGTKLQKVDNATIPMPEILLFVPWRHQTVIVSKCDTINAALFYLNKVVEDNMSRTELEHVVKAQLYEFAIRSKGVCFPFCWGITNPPVLIGRTFLIHKKKGLYATRSSWHIDP